MWPRLFIFQLSTNLLTASENGSYITYVSQSPFGGEASTLFPTRMKPRKSLYSTWSGIVSLPRTISLHRWIISVLQWCSYMELNHVECYPCAPCFCASSTCYPNKYTHLTFYTEVLFFNTCVLISLDLYNIYRSQTTRFLFTWQFSWTNFRMFHCAKYSKPFYLRQCFGKLTTTSLAICPSRVFGTHAHERCYHRNHRSSVSTSQSLGNNR